MAEGKAPAFEMMEGVVILVSGVLLLTPGFLTDVIGLLGLIPLSRRYFINNFFEKNASKVFNQQNTVFTRKGQQSNQANNNQKSVKSDDTIEGEFWED